MTAQSVRFARTLLDRFSALGLETAREIEAAGGPSSSWLTQLRRAAQDIDYDLKRPRGDTARRIDRAARWEPGTARRVYDGGERTSRDAVTEEVRRLLGLASPDEIRAALEEEVRRTGDTG